MLSYGADSVPEMLDDVLLKGRGRIDYFVELHIEQVSTSPGLRCDALHNLMD